MSQYFPHTREWVLLWSSSYLNYSAAVLIYFLAYSNLGTLVSVFVMGNHYPIVTSGPFYYGYIIAVIDLNLRGKQYVESDRS